MAIPTRNEWKKLRTGAGGKEGETKKVSVGKQLDAFHKLAAQVSGEDLFKPLQDLEKAMKTYCAEVKDTNDKLAKVVETKIIAEIRKEKKIAKGVAQHADKIEECVAEIEKLMKGKGWEEDRQKVAGLFRLIRAAADQLLDADPDNAWAQIHRMTVLAHGDIEKLDKAMGKKGEDNTKLNENTEKTIADAVKAIKRYVNE